MSVRGMQSGNIAFVPSDLQGADTYRESCSEFRQNKIKS